MAPPARLVGLFPKNKAGRTQSSRNLWNNGPSVLRAFTQKTVPFLSTDPMILIVLNIFERETHSFRHECVYKRGRFAFHHTRGEGYRWPGNVMLPIWGY